MAELATVARPYAEATFKAALEKNALGPVADSLARLAAAARDEQMHALLGNPKVSAQQKKDVFAAVGGDRLDPLVKSLTSVLVDAHRDVLIVQIAEQFEELKHQHERVLRARITSAQPLNDAQRDEIVAALEKRYDKKIEAELDVDSQLLGGARVQVGDQVVHASVRDALAQMAAALAR
ncbi:MAG: F0F1 ATP synthase subunit delta [Pseudomonadota bacterium]|nr:F0F1 ATP synthase subunit delta [Pseudomonadota bacterium]